MTIHVYGKQGCKLCKSAQKKIFHFLDKWGVEEHVEVRFMDVEGDEDAAAEGDFFDVFDVPTVLVMKDEWQVLGRWNGGAPPSEELKGLLWRQDEAASAAA